MVIVALESIKLRNSGDMDEPNFDFTLPTMNASHCGAFGFCGRPFHDVAEPEVLVEIENPDFIFAVWFTTRNL